ncbi:MAG: class I SAM-dependent methyltransferase [Candidatus Aminicenantes bacterium]|nr:class I SAM-dependent methyltransferase [Candidatus Aminicenantes bacterium]
MTGASSSFDHYRDNLAAERLRACYDAAPARTRRYLEAEAAHVRAKISAGMRVVELGCGYGRFLRPISGKPARLIGIDTSLASLKLAREHLAGRAVVGLAAMNAVKTGFPDGIFDLTLCIQNGVSAFHVDKISLFREAVRITASGGLVLFSSYARAFWPHRLEWFAAQAARGLIGPIDHEATGDGVIVCKDGFHAETVDEDGFRALAAAVGGKPEIVEVDGSSLFCEIRVR